MESNQTHFNYLVTFVFLLEIECVSEEKKGRIRGENSSENIFLHPIGDMMKEHRMRRRRRKKVCNIFHLKKTSGGIFCRFPFSFTLEFISPFYSSLTSTLSADETMIYHKKSSKSEWWVEYEKERKRFLKMDRKGIEWFVKNLEIIFFQKTFCLCFSLLRHAKHLIFMIQVFFVVSLSLSSSSFSRLIRVKI